MPSPPLHRPSQLRTPPGPRLPELTPGTDAWPLVCPAGGALCISGRSRPSARRKLLLPLSPSQIPPRKGQPVPRVLEGSARQEQGQGPEGHWAPTPPYLASKVLSKLKSTGPMCQAQSPLETCRAPDLAALPAARSCPHPAPLPPAPPLTLGLLIFARRSPTDAGAMLVQEVEADQALGAAPELDHLGSRLHGAHASFHWTSADMADRRTTRRQTDVTDRRGTQR